MAGEGQLAQPHSAPSLVPWMASVTRSEWRREIFTSFRIHPWIWLDETSRVLFLRPLLLMCGDYFSQKGERCLCKPGFVGQNCQLGLNDDGGAGQWWRVSEGNPYIPPRTGSAGVYLAPAGSLYMFGGKNTKALKTTNLSRILKSLFVFHR